MRLRALLVPLLGLALVAGCGGDDGDGGKVVEGTGYELTVPNGWNDRTDDSEDFEFAGFEPDVIFTGEREEGFQPNLNVIRESSLGPDVDLEAYIEATKAQLEAGSVAGEDLGSDVDLGEPSASELGGDKAVQLEHSRTVEDKRVKVRQVIALRDGSAYAVTYTALEDRFDDDLERFESAIDSWRWK